MPLLIGDKGLRSDVVEHSSFQDLSLQIQENFLEISALLIFLLGSVGVSPGALHEFLVVNPVLPEYLGDYCFTERFAYNHPNTFSTVQL